MPKNNKIKILCLLIIGIVFLYIYGPIAFMKDGLVTRQSVNSFDELYELGPARRHKCENGTRIYIVYFGWSAPKVKKEIIYVFLTIFLYLLKCPQSLILSALRAFCLCGKPHISRLIFLYFPCQSWLKSW